MHSGSRSIPGAAVAAALAGAFIASACAPARPVNPGAVRADALTSHRVQASLLADPLVGAIAIGVDVHRGVATVTGAAPDPETARRVVEIIRTTPGVDLVVDRLVVDPEGTPS